MTKAFRGRRPPSGKLQIMKIIGRLQRPVESHPDRSLKASIRVQAAGKKMCYLRCTSISCIGGGVPYAGKLQTTSRGDGRAGTRSQRSNPGAH